MGSKFPKYYYYFFLEILCDEKHPSLPIPFQNIMWQILSVPLGDIPLQKG